MLSKGRATAAAKDVEMKSARGSTKPHSPNLVKNPYFK